MASPGKIHLLLHAHLPFVREPDYDRFLEENWFFEAMAETYIPLVNVLTRLQERGLPGALNLSVSPTLLCMLTDGILLKKFTSHLHKQLELIKKEKLFLKNDAEKLEVVNYYFRRQIFLIDYWENVLKCDIISALIKLEKWGKLTILTCVGTHPFLPAYQSDVSIIRLQLLVTIREFESVFGRKPKGLWLPECGYFQGLDNVLAEFGIEYFFLETHGVLLANPRPKYGVFTPIKTPAGLYCMGREQSSSMEVWSRKTGYPGHPEYREFFKDIAYERDKEYLGDYFIANETPIETGLKYYRITGNEEKKVYRPWNALSLVEDHARIFVINRESTVSELLPKMEGNKVSMLCPYDAELFGHWWFEGPIFIEKLFEFSAKSKLVDMASIEDSIYNVADSVCHNPMFSSWGEGGFGEVWMNDKVNEMYPRFFEMRKIQNFIKKSFEKIENKLTNSKKRIICRFISQMAREILLFQSSDFAFMIHNKSADDYAKSRENEHYNNVKKLYKNVKDYLFSDNNKVDMALLIKLEKKNNVFPWICEYI